ncbi:MAG TPA: hypothetical protein VGP02_07260 [Mycobacteriales bacterium]|jgi:hypothetical protein|nr:hypothetical protein [Mycobacteriales bacterium]
MTDLPLEVPEADSAEQRTPAVGGVGRAPAERSPEVPEGDAVEQATPADPDDDLDDEPPPLDVLAEADPADVAEQSIAVRMDDDEAE